MNARDYNVIHRLAAVRIEFVVDVWRARVQVPISVACERDHDDAVEYFGIWCEPTVVEDVRIGGDLFLESGQVIGLTSDEIYEIQEAAMGHWEDYRACERDEIADAKAAEVC